MYTSFIPAQVGDRYDYIGRCKEQAYKVFAVGANREHPEEQVRFLASHKGRLSPVKWGTACILSKVDLMYSCKLQEYVVVSAAYETDGVVLYRGDSYGAALFIARRARAFGFMLYATDVPMEVGDEDAS